MKIEFTEELINKLKNYCQINAINILNLKSSNRNVLFFAEEALSELLLAWHKKNLKDSFNKNNFTDNYYFISCKNFVYNQINKQNAKKRLSYLDTDNLSLDKEYDDINLELELESEENKFEKIEEERQKEMKIKFIVDILEKNKWINEFDKSIFIWYFIEGRNLTDFQKKYGVDYKKIGLSKRKIINIINYLWVEEE